MQKDGPFVPGVVERLLQFFSVCENAETALGIRMGEGISLYGSRFGRLRLLAHG